MVRARSFRQMVREVWSVNVVFEWNFMYRKGKRIHGKRRISTERKGNFLKKALWLFRRPSSSQASEMVNLGTK